MLRMRRETEPLVAEVTNGLESVKVTYDIG